MNKPLYSSNITSSDTVPTYGQVTITRLHTIGRGTYKKKLCMFFVMFGGWRLESGNAIKQSLSKLGAITESRPQSK